LFALTHTHRDFYVHDLDGVESQRIVQPANKGTAPPILFSALSIERIDEDALIAVLPSDHYYSDEACFTAALESAFETAAKRPESVVLIGAQPDRPEVEYGWIALGASVGHESGELYRVRGFQEKPALDVAQTLLGDRSVWNTFVMVGHVRSFLEMAAQAIPDVLEGVRQTELWTGSEMYIEESVYNKLFCSDFSKEVLSPEAPRLLVLRVRDLGWRDLGHPGRVLDVLEESGSRPRWLTKELRKGMAAALTPEAKSAIA
jgi:mannose-1-phosphate guanylyltransferase